MTERKKMRERICFDFDWKFYLGDLSPRTDSEGWGAAKGKGFSFGAAGMDADDSGWRKLDLPHDFVLEGSYTRKQEKFKEGSEIPAMETIDNRHVAGGSLEGGIGWYRKRFQLPEKYAGKRIYLIFDGIYRQSSVYLNHYDIGRHASGYTSFYYDITDFVNFGGDNLLAVRVDATGREGWWYEGGGIYRHVWLEIAEPVHIAPWGIGISDETQRTDRQADAELTVRTEVENRNTRDEAVRIETIIADANGNQVGSDSICVKADAWSGRVFEQRITLQNVHLWNLEDPYLYRVISNLYRGDKLLDSCETAYGIRDIRFDPERGCLINGSEIKIKGVCCHHDHAGVGIGVPDRVWQYRLEKLKEMGCNAYRCAHNPPSKELLDLCDRMGILVLDETRKLSSSGENLEQLRSMVKRDRNHPSVFMWSIGNEEVFAQDQPETERIVRTMKMEVRKLDPKRPLTIAFTCWNGKETFDSARPFLHVSKELDVMGFNYSPRAWEEYRVLMPQQPVLITEIGSNSGTRGCYKTDAQLGHYYVLDPDNEGRAVKKDVAESNWQRISQTPCLSGLFIWTGFDYRGEPSPFSYPDISSHFGAMDYCGFPKDNFYYYKSWWGEEPVLHLFPHWNWPDQAGKPMTVYCYSNLDEVELFVNGESQGRKAMQKDWYLSWENVIYQPGCLSAKGYRNGTEVLSEEVKTTEAPYRIQLIPYRNSVNADGQDTALITVKILDKNGLTVPTADNLVRFEIEGAGTLLGVGNGNPSSHESDKIPARRAFGGMCQLLVRAGKDRGKIVITAASDGIRRDVCVIEAE